MRRSCDFAEASDGIGPSAQTKNDEIVTAFDMGAIEKLGLLKMDFSA